MSNPADRLRERIGRQGPIPFAELMAEALYGEDGYYRRQRAPMEAGGDFVTGSSLSPLFGRATGTVLRRLDEVLGAPADFLEVGYGDGRHLQGLLAGLEGAPERRILACDRVARPVPAGVEALAELQQLPSRGLQGMIFSYELFDALPVHRLIGRSDGTVGELWVDLDAAGEFRYVERPVSDPRLVESLAGDGLDLAPGQIADLSADWAPLYRQLAGTLGRGLLVTCDYGFERQRLLDRRVRFRGTLACYRRHRVHRRALVDVGEQDLTAHVDFTALRRAGEEEGLETVAWTRQARWLMACGLFEQIGQAGRRQRFEALELLDPEGMGEEIRVLIQARDIAAESLFDAEILGARQPS